MGADLGALDEDQVKFLIRAMRHDAKVAEDYYSDLLHSDVAPLRAPVISVVGDRDPGVEFFEERFREWHMIAERSALVVMAEAGHYFLKFRAEELAQVLTTVHDELDRPLPPRDLDATWQLRGISSAREDEPVAEGAEPAPVDDGPQPSM